MSTIPARRSRSVFQSDADTHISLDLQDEIGCFAAQIRAATELQMPLIYGVLRRGSPVIKIGTSAALTGRIGRFGAKGSARLVAIAHGGRDVERLTHSRLSAARVTVALQGDGVTEHFLLTDDVVAWVNETREAIGLQPMTGKDLRAYSA